MKSTAHLLGLVFAAAAVTALGVDKPVSPDAEPVPPVAALPAEPKKAEPTAEPAPFSPLANPKPEDAKPADPDVLELPKMVVKQKPRPRLTPEIMMSKKAFGEELAKQKYSALDQALNKFTLPLFGTSLAQRALEDHEREKRQEFNLDVLNLAKALDTVDPAEAKSLREAAAKP